MANLFPLRPFLTRFPRTGPMLGLCWIFIFLIFKGHDFQILSICRYFFSPSTSSSVLHLSGYLKNLRLHHAETCQVFSSLLFANHYSVVVAYKYWIEIDHSRPLKFFFKSGSLEAKYNEIMTGFTLLCRYQHVIVNILIYCVTVTVMW